MVTKIYEIVNALYTHMDNSKYINIANSKYIIGIKLKKENIYSLAKK